MRVTKYFPVKNISHRLSPGVIHTQKVLKPVLLIHLPFNSPKVPALCSWWIQTFFFFSFKLQQLKTLDHNHSLGGVRGRYARCSILLHPHALFWAALWANVLSKMIWFYWNACHCFILFRAIFLPIAGCSCENEMPSCGWIFISQTRALFSEKIAQLSWQLENGKRVNLHFFISLWAQVLR